MNVWEQILNSIDFPAVIGALITAVLIPVIKKSYDLFRAFVDAKKTEVYAKVENDTVTFWLDRLDAEIDKAVVSTNQTMVDSLKNMGEFTQDKWMEAYEKTKNAALSALSESALNILQSVVGDFDTYVDTRIQASVKAHKIDSTITTLESTGVLESTNTPTVIINTNNAEVVEKKE